MTAFLIGGCSHKQGGQEIEHAGNHAAELEENQEIEKTSAVVVMTTESEPEAGFDPAYGWGAGEHVHEPLIQSTLTATKEDLTIGYDLATEMDVSEDGLIWTVDIRTDAVFTDGEPLTAEDVAFTYNTLKETSSVNDFTMLDRAEAEDEDTVVFHMKHPYSIWPYTMASTGIVPEHAYGPDYGMHPIGSGRYVMKQWDKGQQVIFEANPDYYGEAPQEVSGYRLMACESVDNRGFNLPAVPAYTDENGVKRGNDFTSDVRVRQAINLGIDRQAMIDHVLNGFGSPAYSVCDKLPWYNPEAETDFDPEQAARLLDEAGWTEWADGIREKDGTRAELEILYPADDSVRQALAMDTSNQLASLGIQASARGVGWDTAYTDALSQPLMWGWGAHTPMELYNIYHTMNETGLAEYSPYSNETVDKYMDEALESSDLESSYDLWKKAQWDGETGITQDGDIPWNWHCNIDHLYFVKDGLKIADQKIHPHGHGWSIVNNVDQWTWE